MTEQHINKSKFLSFILRHNKGEYAAPMDSHGWVKCSDLYALGFTEEMLTLIVSTDSKGRYSFSSDKTKIRANQGHSVAVDVQLAEMQPPAILYHGTADHNIRSIKQRGLIPNGRLYVHLSGDVETATTVGERHGNPVVLKIDTNKMIKDGITFFKSTNGVWLTTYIDPKYITFP